MLKWYFLYQICMENGLKWKQGLLNVWGLIILKMLIFFKSKFTYWKRVLYFDWILKITQLMVVFGLQFDKLPEYSYIFICDRAAISDVVLRVHISPLMIFRFHYFKTQKYKGVSLIGIFYKPSSKISSLNLLLCAGLTKLIYWEETLLNDLLIRWGLWGQSSQLSASFLRETRKIYVPSTHKILF